MKILPETLPPQAIASLVFTVRSAVTSGRGRLDSTERDDPKWVADDCRQTWTELQRWLVENFGYELPDIVFSAGGAR